MNYFHVIRALLYAAVLFAGVSVTPAAAATMNVYLSGGQSNEVGRPAIAYTQSTADSIIKFHYEIAHNDWTQPDLTRWEAPVTDSPDLPRWLQNPDIGPFLLAPQPFPDNTIRTGPEIAFARRIYTNFGGAAYNIVIAKFAVGGSRLDGEWVHSNTVDLSDRMLIFFSRVKASYEAQGNTVVFRAYRHNQGESDTASVTVANRYYDNLKAVIAKVRMFSGNPTLPIIISRTHANYAALTPADAATLKPAVDIVRAAQAQIVSEDSCAALVDTDGLPQDGLWHYSDPYLLGAKHYTAAYPLISGTDCYLPATHRRTERADMAKAQSTGTVK